MYSQNHAALYCSSLDINMFTCVYFLQGPDATDECWLQHSQESLYMNMFKWKTKHLGNYRYVLCFRNGTKLCDWM